MSRKVLDDITSDLRSKKLTRTQKDIMWTSIEEKLDDFSTVNIEKPRQHRKRRSYVGTVGAAVVFACVVGTAIYGLLQQSQKQAPAYDNVVTEPKNPDKPQTLQVSKVEYVDPPRTWSGIDVVEATQNSDINVAESMAMPLNPKFQSVLLKMPNTKLYSLFESRQIAGFPIHEWESVSGWNITFTEGVQFPVRNYLHGTFTGTTWKPVQYYDIFTSTSGESVAITQTIESDAKAHVALIGYLPGSKCVQGFGDNLAFIFEDKKDNFKELTVYMRTSDNKILKMIVDGTSVQNMVAFAKLYLSGPTK